MDFGWVPEDDLNKIDFSLKADPALNKVILNGKLIKKT